MEPNAMNEVIEELPMVEDRPIEVVGDEAPVAEVEVNAEAEPEMESENITEGMTTAEEFDAAVDSLRSIAEKKRKKKNETRVRPGVFRTKGSAKPRALTEEEIVLQSQKVRIFQSYANKTILMGEVVAIGKRFMRLEGEETGHMQFYVVVMYGEYQVHIPVSMFTDTDMRTVLELRRQSDETITIEQVTERYLMTRIHSIVPFVVTDVVPTDEQVNGLIVIGSRIDAMAMLRVRFWYGKTADKKNDYRNAGDIIYALAASESDSIRKTRTFEPYMRCARVITVTRGGIRIELDGAETFIPIRDLSWNQMADARKQYKPGDTVSVMIKSITRKASTPDVDNCGVDFTASVKEVGGNPKAKYISMFNTGTLESGEISYVRMPTAANPNAVPRVFVLMDKTGHKMQCMCPFPNGKLIPKPGMRVIVRITVVNTEKMFLYGHIYQMDEATT